MVANHAEVNDKCLWRQSLDKVPTISKVCVASGDHHKNKKRFLPNFWLVGGDPVVSFHIDTGATCNTLRQQDMPWSTELNENSSLLTFYNATRSEALGLCELKLTNLANGHRYLQAFQVVQHSIVSLLGAAATLELELLLLRHENIYTGTMTDHGKKGLTRLLKSFLAFSTVKLAV